MTDREQSTGTVVADRDVSSARLARVAIFTSCDSFEGFYGGTFGLNRETFIETYRNDFVWEYAEGLRSCGHEVFIYILSYGPAELRRISQGVSVRFLPLPLWLRGVDPFLWRLRGVKYGTQLRDRIAYVGYGDALQKALRQDRIDLLYHQEIWTARFDIVVRHASIPVIGADHGATFVDWQEPAKRRSFKQAASLVCQSKPGLDRARSFGGNAVVMHNAVDVDFFCPSSPGSLRSKNVLAVGRLVEEQKRFSDLLQALQALPDYTLTLVGSGPDEMKLKGLAGELGLSGRIHFTGFVSDRAHLRRLYQECGVFVSTSSWEAVALVVLEAMSCGAPVVATRIASFEELLTDGKDGLLVPVGSPQQVAQAIRSAYDAQEDLGTNARRTVETRYSSAVLYRQLSGLLQSVSASSVETTAA
jgi:glycosyltransferase involved in cell wall biosynthesis